MNDIANKGDIKILVNAFYNKVKKDELLAPIFASRIADEQWPHHLERMYTFWDALLFGQPGFKGNPFIKHINLPISKIHFDRWLYLFCDTINESFEGIKAEEAKAKANNISKLFQNKISQFNT